MKYIFIDETYWEKEGLIIVGATFIEEQNYSWVKKKVSKGIEKMGWNTSTEFKGKYLFSSKGDEEVDIQKRIKFAKRLGNRKKYLFFSEIGTIGIDSRISLIKKIFEKKLPKAKKRGDIIGVFIDEHQEMKDEGYYYSYIRNGLKKLGYILFERPFSIESGNQVSGLILTDVLCYVKSHTLRKEKDEDKAIPNSIDPLGLRILQRIEKDYYKKSIKKRLYKQYLPQPRKSKKEISYSILKKVSKRDRPHY